MNCRLFDVPGGGSIQWWVVRDIYQFSGATIAWVVVVVSRWRVSGRGVGGALVGESGCHCQTVRQTQDVWMVTG
jgi:hypothetical protein